MKALYLLATLTLTTISVRGTNNFAGFALSNGASGPAVYTCRTQDQWNTIANNTKSSGFGSIRLTGFDCDALDLASSAAAMYGLTILAGIFYNGTANASQTAIFNDVDTFKTAYKKYGGSLYLGLTVGNEVNDTPENIMATVDKVRANLKADNMSVLVSTVHVWANIRDNPTAFCRADFIGANAHAFYDGGVTSHNAGDFVFHTVVPALKAACPGEKLMITESGWPSRGSANGAAVASINDEQAALISLNCACLNDTSVSVFAFEYDDQLWKINDNERSFGIVNKLELNDIFGASC